MSEPAANLISFLGRLPARALLMLISLYQRTLSPALPALFGSTCGCRFTPTCSHYAAEAVRAHGALVGGWSAACRLVRCTPFSAGGFDPVPPSPRLRRTGSPQCVRTSVAPLASRLTPLA